MQTISVYIIFACALVYAGWRIYKAISHKDKPGCSKCEGSAISEYKYPQKRLITFHLSILLGIRNLIIPCNRFVNIKFCYLCAPF